MKKIRVLDAPAFLMQAGASNGGHVYWVKQATAADYALFYEEHFEQYDNGQSAVHQTVQTALDACTASVGDVIYVSEGYAETITTAAAISMAKAGVTLVGMGVGNSRPAITFGSTDNAATMTMSGNNCSFTNFVLICGDDGLTNALVVSGDNCYVDVESQDASSAVEFATVVRLDTANNSTLKLKHNGFTAGNAMVSCVRIDDCDNVRINIDGYGLCSTAWVEMVDVASTNVRVTGTLYTQGITNFTRDVVDTVTGSTWTAEIFDASAGAKVSGGSAAALATDDITALSTKLDTIDDFLDTEVAAILAAVDTEVATISTAVVTTIPTDLLALPRCVAKTDGAVLTGNDPLFVISGGPIKILSLVGIVTTIIGGASNGDVQLVTTSPAGTVNLNAAPVAIDSDAAGTSYTMIGTTGVFTPTTAGFVLFANSFATNETEYLAPAGQIEFRGSAAQSGVIAWYLRYVPLSPLSRVTAAA